MNNEMMLSKSFIIDTIKYTTVTGFLTNAGICNVYGF